MPPRRNPEIETSVAFMVDSVTSATQIHTQFLKLVQATLTEVNCLGREGQPATTRQLSVKEYSRSVGLSAASVYKAVKSGEIPSSKIGKRYLIDPDEAKEATKKWKKKDVPQ